MVCRRLEEGQAKEKNVGRMDWYILISKDVPLRIFFTKSKYPTFRQKNIMHILLQIYGVII